MMNKPLILCLAIASLAVNAEEWVSVGASRAVAPATGTTAIDNSAKAQQSEPSVNSGSASLINELSVQVQQLQEEISVLRGLIEQQDHKIGQLEEEQKQRYLDVDRRLSNLHVQAQPAAPIAPEAKASTVAPNSASAAYQRAMDLVKAKEFDQAQAAFGAFIKSYPQDPLFGNALYWSAEVWLVQGEANKAIAQFQRIIKALPEHNKTPDAMYKLGVTYDREGDSAQAKKWFNQLINTYGNKAGAETSVRLAKSYLEKL